jgi:SAM-dependent methyltransferase
VEDGRVAELRLASWLGRKSDEHSAHDRWTSALDHEINWWDQWLETRGMSWPAEYDERLDPHTELSEYHRGFVERLPGPEIRILDVGAGPLTCLGKQTPGRKLTIVAADALAPHYDRLLAKHGVMPIVRTVAADAERLTDVFPERAFDLVNARNCIDHTYDPLEAIRQMIRVAREDSYVLLNHAENEAQNEHYVGMHQWNFTMSGPDFVIRSRRDTINVTREMAPFAIMDFCGRLDGNWLRVHFRKRRSAA